MIPELYRKGGQLTAFFNALFPVFFITLALTPIVAIGQPKNLDIVFYNVENPFDTIDNPETYDEDFTPYGKLSYDTERYQTKLNHISKVVSSVIPNRHPDIIGLSEVENKRVLEDLIQILPKANWKIVHLDSSDGRGIDNAVIYDLDRVEVLESLAIRIDLGANERPTRDILQVTFADKYAKEELVIFVNHWPSRYGGEIESNWKRVRASQTLQATIIRIDEPSENNFVVLGDFNDNPDNESVMGLTNCDTGFVRKTFMNSLMAL
jgi:predicted extracellular nuclease